MAFRFSNRPHKQFLWFLIRRDSRLSQNKPVGIDAGCADMRNRRFFGTETYVGIDLDEKNLAKGKKNNPMAQAYKGSILDAPSELVGDFVHCIQVFVNADFQKDQAVAATRKLLSMVKPGGALLMNTGRKTLAYDVEIEQILSSHFERVETVPYGNWGISKLPVPLSLAVASLMYVLPFTRTWGGHSKTYFKCDGRKPDIN